MAQTFLVAGILGPSSHCADTPKTDTVRASLDSNMLELYAINFML